MQFWQQQIVCKQLQEIQRQQQLQQLDRGALQHNSVRQMTAAIKPVAMNQLPLLASNMPNYALPNNFNGSLPKVSDNSQIVSADNMNWVQPISSTIQNVLSDHMITNDRDQAMQPVGFIHQQLDQSFISLPVSSHNGSMNQYAQSSGIANDSNHAMTKASGSRVGKASDSYNTFQSDQHFAAQGSLQEETSVAMQNIQGKELYGKNSPEFLFSDISSADFQQPNDFQHGFQVQEIHNRQEQGDCSGKFQEKQSKFVGRACEMSSLDPTEEKILFGSEKDDNWGASLAGNLNPCLGNDYFGGLPSIHSGSWSALMQEAVQASSSERGIQEEWSGLDFQKMEQSTDGYSGKQLGNLNDNMQNVSCLTKKSIPLFNDSDAGPSAITASGFLQPFESDDGNRIAETNDPYASSKTVSSDNNIKQLNQAHEQKQLAEGCLHGQVPKSNALWADQACGQRANSASGIQNLDGGWTNKKDMPFYDAKFNNRSSASYSMESDGVGNSYLTDRDDITWRLGGSCVNPNDRVQSAKPDISNSNMQTEVSLIGTYGPDISSINLRSNTVISQQDTNSQQTVSATVFPVNVLVESKGNEIIGNNQNQLSSTPPTSQQAHLRDLPNSAFQGSKKEDQTYAWEQHVSDNKVDGTKGCAVRGNELYARDNIPVNAFNSPSGSTSLYSLNKNVRQSSQNMHELLHKVDQSIGSTAVSTFEMPSPADLASVSRPNQNVDRQRFNFRPVSPAQREPLPTFALSSQAINSGKTKQYHQQFRDIDQTWPTSMPSGQSLPHIETAQRENSSTSDKKHKETLDTVEQSNSLSAALTDISYVELEHQHFNSRRNQELLQQQTWHVSGHEALSQPVNLEFNNQTNRSAAIKNALIARQQHASNDGGGTVAGQFTQALLTPVGKCTTLRLSSFSGAPAHSSSKYYSRETESSRKTITTSQFGNSGPILERKPGPQPLSHDMSQHAALSKTFENVRTSMSGQHQAGLLPHKLSPHVLQSIVSRGLQKQDYQGSKKEKASSEIVPGFANLHTKEEQSSKGSSLNSMLLERVDSGPKTDAVCSVPSLVHSYQENMDKGKGGQDFAVRSSAEHGPNSSFPSKIKVDCSGRTSVPPGVQQKKYSLLHQMQLIKDVNSNPQKVLGQNSKETDLSSDAFDMDSNTGPRYFLGQSTSIKILPDSKAWGSSQSSSASDMKMLSFASKGNEEENPSIPSSEGQNGLQDQNNDIIMKSAASLIGGTNWTKISPRMAPSWFAKYGTLKNDTKVAAQSDPQWALEPVSHPYFFPKVPGGMDQSIVVNQTSDDSQIGNNRQSSRPQIMTAPESSLRSLLPAILDHGTVQGSKKRKKAAVELLPWHKMVNKDQQSPRTISTTELDWAQAANRLPEKVGDDAGHMEDALSISASKRRLILTTQLMQQLLPAAPARMLNVEAASAYETVTFYVARAALADACSMVSSFARDSLVNAEHDYRISEKSKIPEKERASMFCKIVEDFIGRSRKLEHDFLRLDKRTSVLDVKHDVQELERMSIINQLAKFHGRPNMGVLDLDSSSSSGTVSLRSFPERDITELSAFGNLPDSTQYISL